MIEVKPMIPGASSMSTPLWCLVPVAPCGVNERAFIIAGELRGTEVIVVKAGALGHLWSLASPDQPTHAFFMSSPDHLVAFLKS